MSRTTRILEGRGEQSRIHVTMRNGDMYEGYVDIIEGSFFTLLDPYNPNVPEYKVTLNIKDVSKIEDDLEEMFYNIQKEMFSNIQNNIE